MVASCRAGITYWANEGVRADAGAIHKSHLPEGFMQLNPPSANRFVGGLQQILDDCSHP
jgi:hypothetical protein